MKKVFRGRLVFPLTTVTTVSMQAPNIWCLTVQIVNVAMIGGTNQRNDWLLVDAGMPRSAEMIIRKSEDDRGLSGMCCPAQLSKSLLQPRNGKVKPRLTVRIDLRAFSCGLISQGESMYPILKHM